jgi:hypothetical protein
MQTMRVIVHEKEGVFHVYLMGKSKRWAHEARRCISAAEKDAAVAHFEAKIREHETRKQIRAKERALAREKTMLKGNPYRVGDILYYSWGYDQTNI